MFEPFPKLARLARDCTVTEKIDGTNAQVFIRPHEGNTEYGRTNATEAMHDGLPYEIFAGSRTRLVIPGKTTDNYGFAAWVWENAAELVKLGPGRHFGEWWGKGIQRNYGLDERRFSLFHTHGIRHKPDCVHVVPTLYRGEFNTARIEAFLGDLRREGSVAAPGFMNPEGIVVYHEHARVAFKKTFDDRHKEAS